MCGIQPADIHPKKLQAIIILLELFWATMQQLRCSLLFKSEEGGGGVWAGRAKNFGNALRRPVFGSPPQGGPALGWVSGGTPPRLGVLKRSLIR